MPIAAGFAATAVKHCLRQRGEKIERSFAHGYENWAACVACTCEGMATSRSDF